MKRVIMINIYIAKKDTALINLEKYYWNKIQVISGGFLFPAKQILNMVISVLTQPKATTKTILEM